MRLRSSAVKPIEIPRPNRTNLETTMNYSTLRRHILSRMAEPEDLRELRRQAERIRAERAQAARRLFNDAERDRLRTEIRAAGEQPCR